MTGKANLAASVAARLLNRAKQTGEDSEAGILHGVPTQESSGP
jgi:hypothetical protein